MVDKHEMNLESCDHSNNDRNSKTDMQIVWVRQTSFSMPSKIEMSTFHFVFLLQIQLYGSFRLKSWQLHF